MKRVVTRLMLLGMISSFGAGCSDDAEALGVTISILDGTAVYGGCGDASPWPPPEAGLRPCGPEQEYSFEATLENFSDALRKVSVVKVEVWTTAPEEFVNTVKVTGATAAGAAFDGSLRAKEKRVVKYMLDPFGGVSSGTITFRVTFKVDGKEIKVTSSPVDYSGAPA